MFDTQTKHKFSQILNSIWHKILNWNVVSIDTELTESIEEEVFQSIYDYIWTMNTSIGLLNTPFSISFISMIVQNSITNFDVVLEIKGEQKIYL
jgi:hypothetical protein